MHTFVYREAASRYKAECDRGRWQKTPAHLHSTQKHTQQEEERLAHSHSTALTQRLNFRRQTNVRKTAAKEYH